MQRLSWRRLYERKSDSRKPDAHEHVRQQGANDRAAARAGGFGLEAGDLLWYELVQGQVILRKSPASPVRDDLFGALDEWRSPADEKAYGQL